MYMCICMYVSIVQHNVRCCMYVCVCVHVYVYVYMYICIYGATQCKLFCGHVRVWACVCIIWKYHSSKIYSATQCMVVCVCVGMYKFCLCTYIQTRTYTLRLFVQVSRKCTCIHTHMHTYRDTRKTETDTTLQVMKQYTCKHIYRHTRIHTKPTLQVMKHNTCILTDTYTYRPIHACIQRMPLPQELAQVTQQSYTHIHIQTYT